MSSLYRLDQWQESVIHAWWRALQGTSAQKPASDGGEEAVSKVRFPPFDRGHKARLRRGAALQDIALEESPHALLDRLSPGGREAAAGKTSPLEKALPLIAGAVAHVKQDTGLRRSLAHSIGHGSLQPGGKPAVSELRFQRLLRSRDEEDFFQQLRRVLAMAPGAINVAELAQDVFAWQVERQTRTAPTQTMYYRWARDYYIGTKAPANPAKP